MEAGGKPKTAKYETKSHESKTASDSSDFLFHPQGGKVKNGAGAERTGDTRVPGKAGKHQDVINQDS